MKIRELIIHSIWYGQWSWLIFSFKILRITVLRAGEAQSGSIYDRSIRLWADIWQLLWAGALLLFQFLHFKNSTTNVFRNYCMLLLLLWKNFCSICLKKLFCCNFWNADIKNFLPKAFGALQMKNHDFKKSFFESLVKSYVPTLKANIYCIAQWTILASMFLFQWYIFSMTHRECPAV